MVQSANDAAGPAKGFHHGWVVVAAAFLAFGIVYGSVIYSFTVFVNPLVKYFGVSKTQIVLGFTLTNIGTGILGVYAGRLLTKLSIRLAMVIGLVVMSLGFFALSAITALWQFYAIYGVIIAFGAIIVAPLGASALVTNWFTMSRGRALTIATLGTSFGQLLLPRIAASVIETSGWQGAYRMFGILMLVVIPLIWLLATDRPESKGLQPYGGVADKAIETATPALLSTNEIMRRPEFWTIGASYVLTVTVYLALVATMVPYATTFGVSPIEAAQLVVVMGIFAIIGKIGFATFTDRMGLRNTFWIAVALNLVACILMAAVPGYQVLFVASALVGGSAGGVLPLWPGMIAFRFGRHALPQVMGLMSPMVLCIQGFGAPFATWVGFGTAFIVFIVMLLLSGFLSRNVDRVATP